MYLRKDYHIMLKAFITIIKQVARPQTLLTLVPGLLCGLGDIMSPFGITLVCFFSTPPRPDMFSCFGIAHYVKSFYYHYKTNCQATNVINISYTPSPLT